MEALIKCQASLVISIDLGPNRHSEVTEQFMHVMQHCGELYKARMAAEAQRPLGRALVELMRLALLADAQIGNPNLPEHQWHSLTTLLGDLAADLVAQRDVSCSIEALLICLLELTEEFWGLDVEECITEGLTNE